MEIVTFKLFVMDNYLAWKKTEKGYAETPFILQAPYSYYSDSSDEFALKWGEGDE